jgi:hypothetical protein
MQNNKINKFAGYASNVCTLLIIREFAEVLVQTAFSLHVADA